MTLISEKFKRLKKYSKSLSWVENFNMLFNGMGGKFKFSAQDSNLEYFFQPYQIPQNCGQFL